MRVVTWNIQQGGEERASKIAQELKAQAADVVVLTEFRAGSPAITSALHALGYVNAHAGTTEPAKNSVLVAARIALCLLPLEDLPAGCEHHVVGAQAAGVNIIGMYFPQLEEKIPLFAWLEKQTPVLGRSATLVIGDLNTGKHRLDENGSTFKAAKEFENLEHLGWTDLWRMHHPDAREYSWYSHSPYKNGFRLDHAFGSELLASCVTSADYSHACRERGDSDHSALVLEIR